MAMYRCYLCENANGIPGVEFDCDDGANPVCPGCGADAKVEPRLANRLVKLEPVHFHPPSKWTGIGLRFVACKSDRPFPDPKAPQIHATGEPSAVTCKTCKATKAYQDAAGVTPVPVVVEKADFTIEADTYPLGEKG